MNYPPSFPALRLEPDDFNFHPDGRVELLVTLPPYTMITVVQPRYPSRYPEVTLTFYRGCLAHFDRFVYAMRLCFVR